MIIIKPETVTQSKLISSNVPENDNPAYAPATNYTVGQRVMFNHRNYESLQTPNTGNQPDLFPAFWLDIGATNRYRLFDGIVGNPTTNPSTINVTLRMAANINSIALFGVEAATIQVIVTDPSAGVVYNRTITLTDYSGITSWYQYTFAPIGERSEDYLFLDLPQYPAADIQVIIDSGGGTASCGEMVLGIQRMIGTSNYGTQIGIKDYSRKEVDDFGNFIIVQRRFAKTCSYAVAIETSTLASVQRFFSTIRAIPCVFVGDPAREETILYGFSRDFQTVIASPSISDCSIEVEGLT